MLRGGLQSALLVVSLASAIGAPATRAEAQQVAYAASAFTELDSATQAALIREMDGARTRGLPLRPLEAKVREGQIKRAEPARIRSAVAALIVRLDSARAALGASAKDAELVAAADALSAGADGNALRTLRAAGTGRDLAAPLGALAQLVATGVPSKRAASMVVELLRRNAAPTALLTFGNAVESDVGAGVPAEESAVFRLRAIEASLASGGRTTAASPATSDPGGVYTGSNGSTGQIGAPPRRKP